MMTRILCIGAVVACAVVAWAGKGDGGKPPAGPPPDPAIAYILDRDLYVMNDDASNQTRIVRGGMADNVTWSPDGTQLAVTNDTDGWGLYLVGVDGTDLHRIVTMDSNRYGSKGLSWSPVATADGDYKIAFTDWGNGGNRDIFVVNPDGTGLQNLTNSADADEWTPTWSPNARRLAAQEHADAGGTGEVVVYEITQGEGGSLAILSKVYLTEGVADGPLNEVAVRSPAWGNTEDMLAVVSGLDLWVIPVDDPAAAYNVTNSAASEGWPSWSPDDSQVLWADDAGENLYVLDLATGVSTLLHESGKRHNGRGHAWRRNQ